jgi:serine/threonine-protein kinase RsbW
MQHNTDEDPFSQPVVRLAGDLDFRSAPEVKSQLLEAVTRQEGRLTIDLSEVGFVDSSGLSALFEAAKIALAQESQIRLTGVHRNVRRLLSVCGFLQFFHVEPAVEPSSEAPAAEQATAIEACRFELPGLPSSIPLIRRRVEQAARAMGFRESQLRDLLIAVSEAATNALKHGSPRGEESRITVRYEPDGDRLIVEVSDEGPGFDPLAVPVPVPEQMREGGMGVFFIRTLMDEVSFRREESGTTIQMIKYL